MSLLRAVEKGDVEGVRWYLEKGEDVNFQPNHGWTALIIATIKGHVDVVTELLRCGAKVNLRDRNGDTALMHAVNGGHGEIVRLLLRHNADVNLKDARGKTVLMQPTDDDQIDSALMALLMRHTGTTIDSKSADGKTSLVWAACDGDEDRVLVLLRHGAEINAKDTHGKTALMHAAFGGHANIVQLLLERGADFLLRDNDGKTALTFALQERHIDVAFQLLNNCDDKSINPYLKELECAAQQGRGGFVRQLVERFEDIDEPRDSDAMRRRDRIIGLLRKRQIAPRSCDRSPAPVLSTDPVDTPTSVNS